MTVKQILSHFEKQDAAIHQVMSQMEIKPLQPRTDKSLFQLLVSDIIGQQLSVKVADVIEGRFVQLFPSFDISPEKILMMNDDDLRAVGLSRGKVSYIKNLSEKVFYGDLNLNRIAKLPDEEIVNQLTTVKGIGEWTAEMFMLFTLGREDVYSHGDLGLKKGILKLYDIGETYVVDKAEEIVSKWHPLKSYGSLALWHLQDNK